MLHEPNQNYKRSSQEYFDHPEEVGKTMGESHSKSMTECGVGTFTIWLSFTQS